MGSGRDYGAQLAELGGSDKAVLALGASCRLRRNKFNKVTYKSDRDARRTQASAAPCQRIPARARWMLPVLEPIESLTDGGGGGGRPSTATRAALRAACSTESGARVWEGA